MRVILNTGRTVWQGQAIESGKDLQMFINAAAICHINQDMMDELGIKDGDNVKIVSEYGDVIVKAVNTKEELPDGMVYVPMGPWANRVIRPNTDSTATPSFKNVPVDLNPTEEPVLDMPTLMKGYGKISNY
ncbi:tungsten-dependent formylmethanofuran dehydrogenase subunit FwdD [Methanobacterium formicicum]|uniref:Tungsten formylmethanofuran dehydrogenase subunit D n=1 Tax=Methanobacterium formicicum (strain DSM 3637 / PP1) TaxID=1204725 RepID=K2QG81_METFP|nr:tungsten-dependent formylmethanofuran dehydrogenase subunit FwdD [Methanobacterium formicicum]EKF87086.1 tungsten formylmethanofuran dehydrogenase subunit D [Methanobacterium formicicum DSM 3637]